VKADFSGELVGAPMHLPRPASDHLERVQRDRETGGTGSRDRDVEDIAD
jgi:hypothetical protein